MKLKIGFSPCPNDTFIFDALVNGKIDTGGIGFEVVMADVEALNKQAFAGDLDITKLSYHAYAYLVKNYVLLDAGSALGQNCGPLLIARQPMPEEQVARSRIAIPGKLTTAHFLFNLAFPNATDKREMVFSEIETAVLKGDVDAGLIIHENRFTYQDKGLVKIMDLGEFWESGTGLPIPLGGIVVKRSLPAQLKHQVNRLVGESVRYAMANPAGTKEFVKCHSQEMEDWVIDEHIKLYVNDFTVNLGGTGRTAVSRLFDVAKAKGIIPFYEEEIFLN